MHQMSQRSDAISPRVHLPGTIHGCRILPWGPAVSFTNKQFASALAPTRDYILRPLPMSTACEHYFVPTMLLQSLYNVPTGDTHLPGNIHARQVLPGVWLRVPCCLCLRHDGTEGLGAVKGVEDEAQGATV